MSTIKTKDGVYSELTVLQSNAGYFIGRIFTGNDGFEEPGSRESNYFTTRKQAEFALEHNLYMPRDCPENQFLYEQVDSQ